MATLAYAKAQNNNHLISEAVGLYTAGIFFPGIQGQQNGKKRELKSLIKLFKIKLALMVNISSTAPIITACS